MLLVLFAGSGCSALNCEIVWYQLLQLVIGSTAVSLDIRLAAFTGGLCLDWLAFQRLARRLYDDGVPLHVVETAFLLGSLRRLIRPADAPKLSPIRSLAHFRPVIDELRAHPAPEGYLDYLRLKLRQAAAALSSDAQKSRPLDDR